MKPIRTDETIGIYGAPPGMEDVVEGLPYWRDHDAETGGTVIRSVWTFDPDEKEAIALGGNLLLGILGEPIPPVQLQVLSPIDVPAFGMPAVDPLHVQEEYAPAVQSDRHDAGLVELAGIGVVLVALAAFALIAIGFFLGRAT